MDVAHVFNNALVVLISLSAVYFPKLHYLRNDLHQRACLNNTSKQKPLGKETGSLIDNRVCIMFSIIRYDGMHGTETSERRQLDTCMLSFITCPSPISSKRGPCCL